MLRKQRCFESFVVECVGVQFSDAEQEAQALLAAIVFEACNNSNSCLPTIRCDKSIIPQLIDFCKGKLSHLTLNQSGKKPYCHATNKTVVLHCLCCPWIEGTTSKAVYGEKLQKSFDMHVCIKCNTWFHKYCLNVCGLQVPKRNHDFCPECKLPSTLSWNNDAYTNTCTCDNILTILLLYCKQYNTFLSAFNSSTPENTLKSGLTLMLNGNLNWGKTVILDYLRSSLNLPRIGNKFNCLGTEFAILLSAFSHVYKLSVTKQCNSTHCPKPSSHRYHGTYGLFPENKGTPFADQLVQQLPLQGSYSKGYCGAEFAGIPPPKAPQGVNDKLVVELNIL